MIRTHSVELIAIANGVLREYGYGKRMTERAAHQLSTLIVIVLFGIYIWGVMHNGRDPFPDASVATRAFRDAGGVVVLLSNFTGYLLPWDQLSFWAITICTGMLDYVPWLGPHLKALLMAGDEIGPAALKLFYTVHVTVLPALFLFLLAYHFWRVRKAGGLVVPPRMKDTAEETPVRVATIPHLIVRELAVAAVLLAGLLVILAFAAGLYYAPFDWDLGALPRDPVPVDAIPDIGENQQIVFTRWMGRSPQDVEDQITYPLTVSLLGIPGVKTIRSYSYFGFSSIYVIFKDDVEFYWSRSRVLEKLNSLPDGTLPEGVQPALGPDATALGQVFWYTLEGRDEPIAQGRLIFSDPL